MTSLWPVPRRTSSPVLPTIVQRTTSPLRVLGAGEVAWAGAGGLRAAASRPRARAWGGPRPVLEVPRRALPARVDGSGERRRRRPDRARRAGDRGGQRDRHQACVVAARRARVARGHEAV